MSKQIVMAVILLGLCGCAGLNKSVSDATDGITVRLTADKRVWTEGDDPQFTVVVRNDGTRQLTTGLLNSLAMEVDGKAFGPKAWGRSGLIRFEPFGPGTEHTFRVSLGQFGGFRWPEEPGQGGDVVPVGKHTIKAALLDNVRGNGIWTSLTGYPKMVLAFSKVVEIDVIAKFQDNTTK